MVEIAYFSDDDGAEAVRDYMRALIADGRVAEAATIARTIIALETASPQELQTLRLARLIDRRDRIWELRPGDHRVAFAVVDDVFVLLHAWRKTTAKLDRRELHRARRNLDHLL